MDDNKIFFFFFFSLLGIFLGIDLTLSQVFHMQEVMPEIRAAREKGKIAFYREGKVVIVNSRST